MDPLLLIVVFFILSLIGAVVLFKWLENSAVVSTPIGKFGGAIAGFIGIYLMLVNSYSALNIGSVVEKLDIPTEYDQYISQKWGFGFGFPKDKAFTEWRKREIVGAIKLGLYSNIAFSAEEMDGDELKKENKNTAIETVVTKQINLLKDVHNKHKVVSIEDYSVNGVGGKIVEMEGMLQGLNILTTLIIVPRFESNILYFFDLTSSKQAHEKYKPDFQRILSTIKFI